MCCLDIVLLWQAMEMMRNPNAMREAMRSQDLAMSQIENHPEGFNALRRMYEEVQVGTCVKNLLLNYLPREDNVNPYEAIIFLFMNKNYKVMTTVHEL